MKKFLTIIYSAAVYSLFLLPGLFINSEPAYAAPVSHCSTSLFLPNQIYTSSSFSISASGLKPASQTGQTGKYGLFIKDEKNNLWIDNYNGHRASGETPIIVSEAPSGGVIYYGSFNSGGSLSLGLIPGNSYTFYIAEKANILGWYHCDGDQTRVTQSGSDPGIKTNTCQVYQKDVLDEDGRILATAGNVAYNDCASGSQPKITPEHNDGQTTYSCVCVGNGAQTGGGGNGIGTPSRCVQTDLGCIPTDPAGLANAIFRLVLGIAGALAILLIIIGGFKVATSAGNPDNLEDGRAMITQAIVGLVFILLATSILAIIGIDILGLTNFFQRTSGGGVIVK